MAEERIYTIPLRKEFLKAPKYKRTSRSIKAVRAFLKKHMKSDDVKIGKYLNLELWRHGRKNPPSKIQVKVTKEDDKIKAELINAPEEVKETKKEKEKKQKEEVKEEKTEKEKVLEKGLEKKEKQVKILKETPKEDEESLQRARNIIPKDEKPHHEKKK